MKITILAILQMDLEINSRIIEIESEKQILIKNIVNLSSINSADLIEILESLIKVKKNVNILRINSFTMKVFNERSFGKSRKSILVWYIVDEDDKMKHIKIRNINLMNNYMKIGVITLKLEESVAKMVSVTGKEQRLVTSQILDESAKTLGAHKKLLKNNLSSVVIVQLDNELISGIAGLTVQLNRLSIPFVVTKNSYQKLVTWLLLTEKQLKNIEPDKSKIVDNKISSSKNWAYTLEGTEMIIDNGMVTYFKVSDDKDKKKTTQLKEEAKNLVEKIIRLLNKIFKNIYDYLNSLIVMVKKLVFGNNDDKLDMNKKTNNKKKNKPIINKKTKKNIPK